MMKSLILVSMFVFAGLLCGCSSGDSADSSTVPSKDGATKSDESSGGTDKPVDRSAGEKS